MSWTVSDIENRTLRRVVLVFAAPVAAVIGVPFYAAVAAFESVAVSFAALVKQTLSVWRQ